MKIEHQCYDIQQSKGLTQYFIRVSRLDDLNSLLDSVSKFILNNSYLPQELMCAIYPSCASIYIYPVNGSCDYTELHYSFSISVDDWQDIAEPFALEIDSAIKILAPFAMEIEQGTQALVKIAHYDWDDFEGLTFNYDKTSKYA